MAKPTTPIKGPKSAISTLVVAALGAVIVTLVAGTLLYTNTMRFSSANAWVQHTQVVLNALQRASLQTERTEYRSQLYLLTGGDEQLNRARTSANLLVSSAANIRTLVADNPDQVQNVDNLAASAQDLARTLNNFDRKSQVPEIKIQRCQSIISLMNDREQSLLKERTQGSQRRFFTSVTTEGIAVALWLLTSLVLFAFLLRDAIIRRRIEERTALTNEHLAQSVNALEDRARESRILTAARDEFQLCVDIQQLYQSAARSFSLLLPETAGSLCMIDSSRHSAEVVSFWGESTVTDFNPLEACCGLRSGNARWRRPGVSEIHCAHFAAQPPEHYLCYPIGARGNTLGILYIQCADDAAVQSVNDGMDGLRQLVQITAMAVAAMSLQIKLENQSIRDALTGLFNRHFMQLSLERELSRAARKKQALAVLMLDVDHFKQFNDTYGHAAGDAVLKAIAKSVQAAIREEDVACRYGGEEFTILLPDVTPAAAYERADALLQAIAHLHVGFGVQTFTDLTASIGIALHPDDGSTAEMLLRRADKALYHSKRQGRNQVALYEDLPVEG
ncbi:MAG TPA: diguanylate cyclase [Terracidiphilus sp.]|jgi:diguanylate cyclase (GGDEF)-like protein|nr:diguanylate cyclase [Terracidiphilus sp.]